MIYRTASFSMTLNDPYPSFNVTPFFDAEYLINSTTYRYSFNEILIGTYTRLILSDLAKYSMTWSVALPLCDSWASSFKMLRRKNCLVRCSWRAWRLTIPAKSDSHRVWKLFAWPASVIIIVIIITDLYSAFRSEDTEALDAAQED